MSATGQVATATGAQGLSGALSVLLMWVLNARYGMTFPPEVSISFSIVLGALLHFGCAKVGGCDTNGDGHPDFGVPAKTEVKP